MLVREARPEDAGPMAEILNAIIALGGTTAHEQPKSDRAVRTDYVDGPGVVSSVVAEEGGRLVGWQSVELWQGEVHIGTFVRPGIQAKGVGTALFSLTRQIVGAAGHKDIIASIRKDNVPGLAYYARMGFKDYAEDPDFALSDGTVVWRVHRRFGLV